MPSGPRIRTDNVFGTVSDNPLTNSATTLNSAGLANLAAVSSAHAILVLDPLRSAGAPEVVIVTAHTGSATSATVTRGAYGTSARQHAQGTLWVHAPTVEDTIRIVTSSTRPSDPYRGQLIFETDTNSYVGRDTSDAWQTVVPLGAWTTWTPTWSNLTVGNGTLTAKYVRIGRTIHWYMKFTLGSTSAVGTDPTFSLPVQASGLYSTIGTDLLGTGWILDTGTANFQAFPFWLTSTTARLSVWGAAGTFVNGVGITATSPMTWTTGDAFAFFGTYEAAA